MPAERDCLGRVVDELNRTVAGQLGFVLELVGWETHARPGLGTDAQAIINGQIEPPDGLVGIFWTRIGTSTPRAESGTVEEIEQAIARWHDHEVVEVMVYFCRRPPAMDDIDPNQIARLNAFKETLREQGDFTRDYSSVTEFEGLVREHLAGWLHDLSRSGPPAVEVGAAAGAPSVAQQLKAGTFSR